MQSLLENPRRQPSLVLIGGRAPSQARLKAAAFWGQAQRPTDPKAAKSAASALAATDF
jgi:hypothetical protein